MRELCRRTLAFENHYLARYRDYLLSHLRSEQRERQLFAARRLKEIVYPELLAAFEAVETDDEDLRQAIEVALGVSGRAAVRPVG